MKYTVRKLVQSKQHIRTETFSVPQIKLEGRWLEQLGFKEGKEVEIEMKMEEIVIRVAKGEEENR